MIGFILGIILGVGIVVLALYLWVGLTWFR
jgi:hypothetical protein